MYDHVIPMAFCTRLYRLSWAIDPHGLSLIYADLVILLALWPDQNTVTSWDTKGDILSSLQDFKINLVGMENVIFVCLLLFLNEE